MSPEEKLIRAWQEVYAAACARDYKLAIKWVMVVRYWNKKLNIQV